MVGFLVRVGLWIVFRADSRMHVSGLLTAVGVGVCNDLIEFLFLALPMTLIVALVRQRFMSTKGARSCWAYCRMLPSAPLPLMFGTDMRCPLFL